MIQGVKNPQALVQQTMNNNAQYKQINDLVQKFGGGDPQKAFYSFAKEMGVDPNEVVSFLNEMGFKS